MMPITRHRTIPLALTGLLAVCGVATAETTRVYNATGGLENGGDSFASGGPILLDRVSSFTTNAVLDSVVVNVALATPDSGNFDVVLTEVSDNGQPIKAQVIGSVSDTTLTTSFAPVTVKPTGTILLKGNSYYYVGIRQTQGVASSVMLGNTVDRRVLKRPGVIAGGYYYNSGGVQANAGGPYEITVTLVP
jgi:hypothetical protein